MSEQSRVTARCDVAHSGRENLNQFLPILLWRHVFSSSIMTLWFTPNILYNHRKNEEKDINLVVRIQYASSDINYQLKFKNAFNISRKIVQKKIKRGNVFHRRICKWTIEDSSITVSSGTKTVKLQDGSIQKIPIYLLHIYLWRCDLQNSDQNVWLIAHGAIYALSNVPF